ncbi:MAG: riboflavin synthase [Rhodobiaceae bacterium]|nr:riboflavin synthase [Rhodobiaceae bacterium]|tara:strand:+ start:2343 stop:2936 length:594 start_codon:yes stop_codon:yes gene_type:complete
MFTGIVIDVGIIKSLKKTKKEIEMTIYTENITSLKEGMSISCAGICLTVVSFKNYEKGYLFNVFASNETLSKTTLSNYEEGNRINLEKSLALGDEMDGHIVQGHVDGVAEITKIEQDGESTRFTFKIEPNLVKFIAPKGSVALDGTSLTVNNVDNDKFDVNLIPYTLAHTTWKHNSKGDRVNIEVDILSRYVLNNKN